MNIFESFYNFIILKLMKVHYKNNLSIKGRIFVQNRGTITIGNNVIINSSVYSNPIGGTAKTIMVTCPQGEIRIGNNVGISNSCLFAMRQIEIEDDVLIGGGCKIYDTDFHSIIPNFRLMTTDPDIKAKPIRICQKAFIGAHCIILKGVTIGECAVVGAGSVVPKDIPAKEVWAGNPAKFIRKL